MAGLGGGGGLRFCGRGRLWRDGFEECLKGPSLLRPCGCGLSGGCGFGFEFAFYLPVDLAALAGGHFRGGGFGRGPFPAATLVVQRLVSWLLLFFGRLLFVEVGPHLQDAADGVDNDYDDRDQHVDPVAPVIFG